MQKSLTWTFESDQGGALLGFAVNTAGDVNADGYDDVIVGSRRYSNTLYREGRVYLFYGSANGLTTTVQWVQDGGNEGAGFGGAVASAGDVNGDGFDDVIIGASYHSNGQNDEGRAYVYLGSSAGLSTTAVWTQEIDVADAWYGYSVNSAGDVNTDGYDDVIVGACLYTNGETQEGAAYVYLGSATGPSATADWSVEADQAYAQMGCGTPVSGVGDVNGDGYDDVLVGAQNYTNGESGEGQVYLYFGSDTGLSVTPDWTVESNSIDAAFGWAVDAAGDVDGDGYADFLIGADEHDVGALDRAGRTMVR
jgi:hypothetical protein